MINNYLRKACNSNITANEDILMIKNRIIWAEALQFEYKLIDIIKDKRIKG